MKHLIVCFLAGGLGNQMFQYALARTISEKIGSSTIVLDASFFKTYSLRNCEIQKFQLCDKCVFLPNGIRGFKKCWFFVHRLVHRIAFKMTTKRQNGMKFYSDSLFQFFAKRGFLLNLDTFYHEIPFSKLSKRKTIYIYGGFQCERYYEGMADLLKTEFVPKNELSDKAKSILSSFGKNEICLSIRCGDLLRLGNYLGNIDPAYFPKINALIQKMPEPKFIAGFTDDAQAAKLAIPFFKTSAKAFELPIIEQFYVMTFCSVFFLSNSSFSWWGAFLSKSQNCVIYAPRYWYKNSEFSKLPLFYPKIQIL